MTWRNPRAAPVRLVAMFALMAGIPLVALGWLGYRVIQQDRSLESQRLRERLDNAAALLAREIDRALTAWEDLLPAVARGEPVICPAGGVCLTLSAEGVVRQQGVPLAYYPRVEQPATTTSPRFAEPEALEFQQRNLAAALAAYRELARSAGRTDPR